MMQVRMQADAFIDIIDKSSYLSSGSEHELSSVCLAEMVHNFLEDEPLERCLCGRARCNCDASNAVSAEPQSSSLNEPITFNLGGELRETLKDSTYSVSTVEKVLLADVKKAISYVKEQGIHDNSCNKGCFRRAVMKHLRGVGYNAAICKSRWNNLECMPAGEYDYMDVIFFFNEEPQRVIIDVQFAAQFEIARPSGQYRDILENLPSIFVGKADRLLEIINVMSTAVKQSLKNNGMPLPPWRRPEYIKAKWFSSYRRTTKSVGRHLDYFDIMEPDIRWGRRHIQYETAEAKFAGKELGIMQEPNNCFEPSKRGESAFKSIANNFQCDVYGKTKMLTNWQPPVVDVRGGSTKGPVKIAGLASALVEAGLTTLVTNNRSPGILKNEYPWPANLAAAAITTA